MQQSGWLAEGMEASHPLLLSGERASCGLGPCCHHPSATPRGVQSPTAGRGCPLVFDGSGIHLRLVNVRDGRVR